MNRKSIYSVIAVLMISLVSTLILPADAWSYGRPGIADDSKFEKFGPRADRLLIKLYASETSEWDTGLETGQIDVTDSPLDGNYYSRYSKAPWNETVRAMGYGAEFGLNLFDLNNNNNLFLGNPPDPTYPNPVWPNPMSTLSLRKAVAYLANRPKYVAFIGATVASALYTPVGPAYSKYSDPDIQPGGALEELCYLYSQESALAELNAGGFPMGSDSYRYWDRNDNAVKDVGEDFTLKIVVRADSPALDYAGTDLDAELRSLGIHTNLRRLTRGAARTQVMANKNFHIYTGSWNLGADPDYLILWNWDFYWHPGRPYNSGGCNDPAFNSASYSAVYANDQSQAVMSAYDAQVAFATSVLSVPLWATNGYKAIKRTYTGTPGTADIEDIYEGDYWEGFVNGVGQGVDRGYSFLNMHPEGHGFGRTGNNMTIRYGFKTQEIRTMNPVYAESLWDNTIIGLIGFDSLLSRNPYDIDEFQPWLATRFSVSTYTHPAYGTCTKCVFTLRPAEWSDGTPVTTADILFTFAEIDDILDSRGLPPPWWISNIKNILSFSFIDPLNFEVLLDVKSVFAVGWIGGNRILPKHVWKPLVNAGDPTAFAPDPNLINSGPWRLVEYKENDHILLTANEADKAVKSGLSGSTLVKSDQGFFRWVPLIAEIGISDWYYKKQPPLSSPTIVLRNAMQQDMTGVNGTILVTYPNATAVAKNFGPVTVPGVGAYSMAVTPPTGYGMLKIHIDIWWPNQVGKERVCSLTGAKYKWHWCRTIFWITITEDIAGSTWYNDVGLASYPYKNELVSPDLKVDIKDVARASGAFGSYPGHTEWNAVADITGDYKIDIKDLAKISARFGFHAS